MPQSPWMGESGARDNTQGYSTHSENPSSNQISSSIPTDETFGLATRPGLPSQALLTFPGTIGLSRE